MIQFALNFGEFDTNGVWRPKDLTDLDFSGAESFWLDFADNNDFGNDVSGQNNDGTVSSGFIIAHLSTTDQDTNDTHTYELVSGSGSTHNELFIIDRDRLKANHDFEYPTQTSYEFRLRTTDNKGLYFENASC